MATITVPKHLEGQVAAVAALFRRRQIVGSYAVALKTAILLRLVVTQSRWSHPGTLLGIVRTVGKRLIASQPQELCIGNVVRQVLHLIREEYVSTARQLHFDLTPGGGGIAGGGSAEDLDDADSDLVSGTDDGRKMFLLDRSDLAEASSTGSVAPGDALLFDQLAGAGDRDARMPPLVSGFASPSSMYNLFGQLTIHQDTPKTNFEFKPAVMEGLNEMIEEIENCHGSISSMSLDHIHTNEIIMTLGFSKTVERFLIYAAKKRKFQVIIAETAPIYQGQELAASLTAEGIDVTLITDSAIFAVMSRVNKVILGCHVVLANGGLMAVTGTAMIAAAARAHSTPVVVCTGLYKLSPVYSYDEGRQRNALAAPDAVINFTEGNLIDKVDIINPLWDYVPPEHVSLFITNFGGHPPSYFYRLINENYDPQDLNLE